MTIHRDNLLTLANYLDSLPEDYTHFHMSAYYQDDDLDELERYARENGGCNTVACAVGHGPSAGFLFTDDLFTERHVYDGKLGTCVWRKTPDWERYGSRYFLTVLTVNNYTPEFQWCFGSVWVAYDNHHYGAAARIRYMLDKGVPEKIVYEDTALYAEYRKHVQP